MSTKRFVVVAKFDGSPRGTIIPCGPWVSRDLAMRAAEQYATEESHVTHVVVCELVPHCATVVQPNVVVDATVDMLGDGWHGVSSPEKVCGK